MAEYKGTKAIRGTQVYTTQGPRTTDASKVNTPSMGSAPRTPVGADNTYVRAATSDALAGFKDTTKMHKSHGGRVIRKGW